MRIKSLHHGRHRTTYVSTIPTIPTAAFQQEPPLTVADTTLKQVPLIKNPLYQPPKAVTLNTNYNKLIPTLTKSVPPKVNISQDQLGQWRDDIEALKKRAEAPDLAEYTAWIAEQQLKVAPGFDFGGVMTPSRKSPPPELNELDKVFGKTSIGQ